MKEASLPQLPQPAVDHLPAPAVANMPPGLVPPPVNVVQVPVLNGLYPVTLQATSADDYYVIDANSPGSEFAYVNGFDPAHDHVVIENLNIAGAGYWTTFNAGPIPVAQYSESGAAGEAQVSLQNGGANLEISGSNGPTGGAVELLGLSIDPLTFVQNNLILTSGTFGPLT